MVFGFCDVMMQSSNLGNVQNYSSSCIHLLVQLLNICRYGYFNLRFGQQLICYLQIFNNLKVRVESTNPQCNKVDTIVLHLLRGGV
jgi:hypothetical protein